MQMNRIAVAGQSAKERLVGELAQIPYFESLVPYRNTYLIGRKTGLNDRPKFQMLAVTEPHIVCWACLF